MRPPGTARRAAPLVIAALVLLTACGADRATAEPSASSGEVVGDWVLAGGKIDGADAPVLPDHRITLTISGSSVSGIAACNHYGGEIVIEGDGLHLDSLHQTLMGCEEPAMRAEQMFTGALTRVRDILREGDELVARGNGVELRFDPLLPPPSAEGVGLVDRSGE